MAMPLPAVLPSLAMRGDNQTLPDVGGEQPQVNRPTHTQSMSSWAQAMPSSSTTQTSREEPVLLPRRPAKQRPHLGKISTTHISGEGATMALSRMGPFGGGAGPAPDPNISPTNQDGQPIDRKWHVRQASLSATLASQDSAELTHRSGSKRGRQSARNAAQAHEYVSFENWGVGNAYFCTLLCRVSISVIKIVNVAGNRLTVKAVDQLCGVASGQPFAALRCLSLSRNNLGWQGGKSVAKLLAHGSMPLQELDLSDNNLGDQSWQCQLTSKTISRLKRPVEACSCSVLAVPVDQHASA